MNTTTMLRPNRTRNRNVMRITNVVRGRVTLLLAVLMCTRGGLLVRPEYRHLADAAKAPREGWGKAGIPSARLVVAAPELTVLVAVPAVVGRWHEASFSLARQSVIQPYALPVIGSRAPPFTA